VKDLRWFLIGSLFINYVELPLLKYEFLLINTPVHDTKYLS